MTELSASLNGSPANFAAWRNLQASDGREVGSPARPPAAARAARRLVQAVRRPRCGCTAAGRRPYALDAQCDAGRERMAKHDYSANGHQHAACPFGQRSARLFGFVNPPVVHASTVLFPDAATMAARNQKYTYGTRGTPTTDALASAIDALEGSAGTIVVPSGPGGGDGAAARLPVGRRPCADRRFRLPPDPPFRRHHAEAAGRRGRVLRSACRRRHRRADEAQHEGRVHRIAGLQHFRGAGHSGDRAGGACRRVPS